MQRRLHPLSLLALSIALATSASAVSLDAPVSSTNLLEPGPIMATTELRLDEWETISLTTLIDGREELVARASAGVSVNAHFTNATFTLTSAPPGIEIVDGLIDSSVNNTTPRLKQPPFLTLLVDTITLRAPAGTFTPSATFFTSLSGPGFTWQVTAAELPVLASGVFVVEDLVAGLDYGYPFSGRRALNDNNNYVPQILEKINSSTYRFVIPGLETSFPQGSDEYGLAVGNWANELKNTDETTFFTPFANVEPTDPNIGPSATHTALVLISNPELRALLPPEDQALLPPATDLPRQFGVSGYYPHLLPNGHHICAFNLTLNMADPPPLNLPINALIQSGTLVGAFGTSESENGPPDTLGSTQGDPNSPNGENGLINPQYWPQQAVQITDGLSISGQASLRRITGRALIRIRLTPWFAFPGPPLPFNLHLEAAGEIEHSAALTVTAERDISLGETTVPVLPAIPLPIVVVPAGPLALTLAVTPSLDIGASGEISAAGSFGWSQTTVTSFSSSVDGGLNSAGAGLPVTTSFTSTRTQSADSQTGPFVQTSCTADLRGFLRAGLGVEVSLSGFISSDVQANVDIFADLHVDPLATPWWDISTGIDPFFSLNGRILGLSFAGVDSRSDDQPANSSPHISATSPPDPLGRPAGADTHWAKALTYTNLPLATDSTDVIPLPNKGLVTLNTLSPISLMLVEFDPYGTEVRRRALGNVLHSANRPKRVRLLPDGGLLVFASPVLIRLDASWNVVWQKNLVASSGNTLRFYDMDVAPGAGSDFSAYIASGTDVISGPNDSTAVAIKLDANGDLVWSKAYVTQGEESFFGIRATPDGGCVAVGKTDAKWNDIREFTYMPPEGSENPFPDELDNGYVVRIAPDGSVLWAWSAAILSFNDVAVQPDGRIAASGSSLGHGIYDPWRGPAIHVFNADGSSAGGSSFAVGGMPGVNKEGNLDDYASAVTTGTDGGWVLACKTGPANQTPAASFIVALSPKLFPKWLIGYDWHGSPREVPERIINRGDSYFFMGILDDGRINGAAAKDFVFLSCLPDTGLCSLFPSNRLTHGFFSPVTDAFDGKLLLNLAIGGAPRELVPLVGNVTQVLVNNYTQTITNPATTFTLTPLTDSVPSGPAPPLTIAPGTDPGSLMLSWPTAGGSGYSIFESPDLQAWEPSPLVPTISDGHYIAEPPIGPDPKKFWRIEPTGSTQ